MSRSDADARDADDGDTVVDLPPPSREVALSAARFLAAVFTRQVLADLGLLPAPDPGIAGAPGASDVPPSRLAAQCRDVAAGR